MGEELSSPKYGELSPEWIMTPEEKEEASLVSKEQSLDTTGSQEIAATDHSFENLLSELDKAGCDKDRLLEICKPENLIGRGGNADVYNIPGVDRYVLRVNRSKKKEETNGEISKIVDAFPEFNIGQAVAEIQECGMSFLRRQDGIPASVPCGELRRDGGEEADSIYQEHLKNVAEMPQEAFDEFAHLLIVINDRGYQFDPSKVNNVLVDAENERFNLVDVNKRSETSTYRNGVADMAVTLIDNAYAGRYKGLLAPEHYRRMILEKCIEAANKTGLKIPGNGENSSLDYSFKLAGIER